MALTITNKGNQIPGWSSFGGQNKSYGSSPKSYAPGLEGLNLDPLNAPDHNVSTSQG